MSIRFTVYGTPAPGGSKTGFPFRKKDGTLGVSMSPASKKTKPWMALVQAAAMDAYDGPLLEGPLELQVFFYFDRPKHHYRTGKYSGELKTSASIEKVTSPDCTKCLRSTEDSLEGILFHNDSQIVRQITGKGFCKPGERPRAEIHVTELS